MTYGTCALRHRLRSFRTTAFCGVKGSLGFEVAWSVSICSLVSKMSPPYICVSPVMSYSAAALTTRVEYIAATSAARRIHAVPCILSAGLLNCISHGKS